MHRLATSVAALVVAVTGSLVAASPSTASPGGGKPDRCPQLKLADRWYGDNAERIQRAIDEVCQDRGRHRGKVKPYAVFDFDNTLIKNDISDQTIFWMLRNDKILQPPNRDWRNTSRYMTDVGADALAAACGDLAKPGRPLPTSTDLECADEILSVRKNQTTTDGDDVFGGYDHRIMEAMYAWVGQIMQGYTPAQVRDIAAQARTAALKAPVGATQRVGSSDEIAWIRYYPEMQDLVSTLKKAGIEPWIVSASPKEFADVWGDGIGIDRKHTLGVSQLTTKGRLNGHLEGCGGIPDGRDAIMTYVDGKRCFVNEKIVGITGKRALEPAPKHLRPVLAAGDANTDVSMVRDAVGVHVVLNRNGTEVMCLAYDDADGRWAPNPMFIQPRPKQVDPYPCSTTAYTNRDGSKGPMRRDDGSIIPDQEDRVFG